MATKANHHYIPQFYLRKFAEGVDRQAKIFVFDSDNKRTFTTLVRNVGSRRHFNRVEFVGLDPNALEDQLAKVEAIFANHLAEVISARAFPTPEHFNSMMNLIATLSVRNPRMRRQMTGFHQQVVEKIMSLSLSSERIWQSQIQQAIEAGVPIKDDIPYEEMKRFHESKEYDVVVDQTYLIEQEMKMIDPVLECSARRHWCFASSPADWQYITSDDPVVLSWIDEEDRGPWPPGHGLAGTIVIFTLSPDLALVGTHERLPQHVHHTPRQVVGVNTSIARYSSQQIYAKNGNFVLNLRDREYVRGSDLKKYLPV